MTEPTGPGSRADTLAELLRRAADFVAENRTLIDAFLAPRASHQTMATGIVEPREPETPRAAECDPEAADAHAESGASARDSRDDDDDQPGEPPSPAHEPEPSMPIAAAIDLLRIGTGVVARRTDPTAPASAGAAASNPILEDFLSLRRLARAHERGTRALRRIMRDGANEHAWNSLEERVREIAMERSVSWLSDPSLRMLVPVDRVRALQVRYDTLGESLGWLCDFLREHPDVARMDQRWKQRPALQERIQAVATAQCGLRCEIDEIAPALPALAPCSLQERTFHELRSIIRRDALAMLLHDMARADVVTIRDSKDLRDRIERERAAVDRVDLSQAREDAIEVGEGDDDLAPPQEHDSVADAYRAAWTRFGGTGSPLIFTRRAADSAERSGFCRPDEVYRAIEALHAVTREWHDASNGSLGCAFRDRMRALGFDEKDCSDGTMQRWSTHYSMRHDGRSVPLGKRVTLGSRNANTCLSIHWWRDESRRVTVIGHCGRHLPNTLT